MNKMYVCLTAVALAGCVNSGPTFEAPPGVTVQAASPLVELSSGQRAAVEGHVRSALVDPQSAMFEGMRSGINPNNGNVVTCGLVNARNRMGGFAGREVFFVSLDPETNQPTNESPFFFAATICGNFRLV